MSNLFLEILAEMLVSADSNNKFSIQFDKNWLSCKSFNTETGEKIIGASRCCQISAVINESAEIFSIEMFKEFLL